MMRSAGKNDRPHLKLDFWKLKEILVWPMPFFPLTRINLLTLAFYFDFLSQISPKVLKLPEQFCDFTFITCCSILSVVVNMGLFEEFSDGIFFPFNLICAYLWKNLLISHVLPNLTVFASSISSCHNAENFSTK